MPASHKRREQNTAAPRSSDYPIHPPGGTDYVLKGIETDLRTKFMNACDAGLGTNGVPRSMRWVLLSMMHKYAKGEIQL
jgi:hypothetical protein